MRKNTKTYSINLKVTFPAFRSQIIPCISVAKTPKEAIKVAGAFLYNALTKAQPDYYYGLKPENISHTKCVLIKSAFIVDNEGFCI